MRGAASVEGSRAWQNRVGHWVQQVEAGKALLTVMGTDTALPAPLRWVVQGHWGRASLPETLRQAATTLLARQADVSSRVIGALGILSVLLLGVSVHYFCYFIFDWLTSVTESLL